MYLSKGQTYVSIYVTIEFQLNISMQRHILLNNKRSANG